MAISLAFTAASAGPVAAEPPLKPLPASITGDTLSRTIYYQKNSSTPGRNGIRTTDWQDPQPDSGTIPLPPSVLAVIERSKLERIDRKDLFALKSESEINREIVRESGDKSIYGQFPTDYKKSDLEFKGRSFEARCKLVEPNFVCHRRLYFEERNSERQAWELGPLQPITSTMCFLGDFFTMPYHFATRPCDRWECSAGKCLPGDPTPYLLYPVEFSASGGLWEAGVIIGLAALIP